MLVMSLVLTCSSVAVVLLVAGHLPQPLAASMCSSSRPTRSLTSLWRRATGVSISANCEQFRLPCGHLSAGSWAGTPADPNEQLSATSLLHAPLPGVGSELAPRWRHTDLLPRWNLCHVLAVTYILREYKCVFLFFWLIKLHPPL